MLVINANKQHRKWEDRIVANFTKAERTWLNDTLKLNIQLGEGSVEFESNNLLTVKQYFRIVKGSFGTLYITGNFGENCTSKHLNNGKPYNFINAHCNISEMKKLVNNHIRGTRR
jgi:hypothetical protein